MWRLTRIPGCSTSLVCLCVMGLSALPLPAAAQATLAAEPTYRYAGRYEGEWQGEAALDAAAGGMVLEQRAGALRGTLMLDVGCDGAVSGQAQGQTVAP